MSVFVAHKQYDAFLRSIEKANLKAHGKSTTAVSMHAGKLIIEIQDARNGMLMEDNWREEFRHRYLVPTQTPQEVLQDILLNAAARTKKSRRTLCVIRFTAKSGATRYKIYPDTKNGFKAFDDCKVGERIELLGRTYKQAEGNHPIPFWPQEAFKAEYSALPLVHEFEMWLYGKPAAEHWADLGVE